MFDDMNINELFEIGIHLTSEKNYTKLLSSILDYAMQERFICSKVKPKACSSKS